MRVKLSLQGSPIEHRDGLYWAEVLRPGSWEYPGFPTGGFDIDETVLDEFAANFRAGEKGSMVPLNLNHKEENTIGWVKALERRGEGADARLWAGFEIEDAETKDKVDRKLLRFTSSELNWEWRNPEACRTHGDCEPRRVFEGLALTNRPYIKGLQPIQLAEILDTPEDPDRAPGRRAKCKCGEQKPMPKTAEELQKELDEARAQLAERGSEDLKAKLAEETRKRQETERQVQETNRRLRELETNTKLTETNQRIRELVRKRHITPAVANRVTRIALALIQGGQATVTLSEKVKVKLAEGNGEESLDKLDVVREVLDMLQELPDALSKDEIAQLEEDESDKGRESESEKIKAAEGAARERAKKGGINFRAALAEELTKRGVGSQGGKG